MKTLLMILAMSAFSFAVIAQTAAEPSNQESSTEVMGAQQEVYPELSTPQEEEEKLENIEETDETSIQEEVDTESEDTMRTDTIESGETELEDSSTP